jgi:hypothetical protein
MRANKYHNKKVSLGGEVFDSKKELRRYNELLLIQRAGEISDLKRQVEYELIPAQYETRERYSEKTGKRLKDKAVLVERRCCYVADFVYTDVKTGKVVVEDTKSPITRTTEYIVKRKLMLHRYGIRVREV